MTLFARDGEEFGPFELPTYEVTVRGVGPTLTPTANTPTATPPGPTAADPTSSPTNTNRAPTPTDLPTVVPLETSSIFLPSLLRLSG